MSLTQKGSPVPATTGDEALESLRATVPIDAPPGKDAISLDGVAIKLSVSKPTAALLVKYAGFAECRIPSRGAGRRAHVRYCWAEVSAWAQHGFPPAAKWRRTWSRLRGTAWVPAELTPFDAVLGAFRRMSIADQHRLIEAVSIGREVF